MRMKFILRANINLRPSVPKSIFIDCTMRNIQKIEKVGARNYSDSNVPHFESKQKKYSVCVSINEIQFNDFQDRKL